MFTRQRDQLVRRFLRLGDPACRDRCKAFVDKGISKSVTMRGLSSSLDALSKCSSCLVSEPAVPECPPADTLSGDANVSPKSESELPVLLRPVQVDRSIEMGQRRRITSGKDKRRTHQPMANQKQSRLPLSLSKR